MRKSRILSLLLAVAVMATMLVAVPLTASAAEEYTYDENEEWLDFTKAPFTVVEGSDNVTADESGATLTLKNDQIFTQGNFKYIPSSGNGTASTIRDSSKSYTDDAKKVSFTKDLTLGGASSGSASSPTARYIAYSPKSAGTLKVFFRTGSNNNSRDCTITQGAASKTESSSTGDLVMVELAIKANEDATITSTSGIRIAGAVFVPGGETEPSTSPEPGGGGGGQTGDVTFEAHATPFPSENEDYIDWTFHKEAAIDVSNLDTFKTSSESVSSFSDSVTIDFDTKESKKIDGLTDEFVLPHGKHDSHEGSGYVLMSTKETNLKLNNILPEDCGFDSYDLIFVYNRNADSGNTTTFTLGDGDQLNKEFKDETKDNGRTTDPDELIFGNLNSNSITLTYDYNVDIYSISIDYHKSTPEVFGKTTGTASGYYTTDNTEKDATDPDAKGVIRFFQSFAGNQEVSEYGFYFLDKDANTVDANYTNKASTEGSVKLDTLSGPGMFGDLVDIPYASFDTPYYALPFVKIGGEIVYGTPFSGKVGKDTATQVLNPTTSD